VIRNAGWTDIVRILASRRHQQILRLNPPYTIIQPEAVVTDLVRAQSPAPRRRCHTLVYAEDRDILAYIQVRCRWQRRDEWTITTLASAEREGDALWSRLVAEVLDEASEYGITRVFAKLPIDDDRLELFHSLGFTTYSHERIWGNLYLAAEGGDSPRRGPLRALERRDAFDLLQLYRAITPRVVQQAEALTARQWQPGPRLAPAGLAARAFVWDNTAAPHETTFAAAGVGGWIRLLTGPRGHWVTTLYRPEQRSTARNALDYVFWLARHNATKPLYVALREYQTEIEPLLEDRGFHLLSEQALLVRYTAVLQRQAVPAFAALRAGRLVTGDWSLRQTEPPTTIT
jgi:hypothetical protein